MTEENLNVKEIYRRICLQLGPVSAEGSLEAFEFIRHFCGLKKEQVIAGQGELSEKGLKDLWEAVSRRALGYPLQYLLGEWEFYGRTFTVGPGVLIPRADTETLVESVLSWAFERQGIRMADLCSGSGCIAVTLWCELDGAEVSAVENSCLLYTSIVR